jgi:hypothetical protein
MKALTVKQPWAWAIFHLGKPIENRDWPTNFRGVFAIHTSKLVRRNEYEMAKHAIADICGAAIPGLDELEHGKIIGLANLANCISESTSPWFFGDFGFVLAAPTLLHEPIPAKGALGLWDVPEEIEADVRRQFGG